MSVKTRYLQLSDTVIMEYVANDNASNPSDEYIFTKLLDNHYAIFSPLTKELNYENGEYHKKSADDIVSINTISHLAVPANSTGSELYMFIDNNYNYVDASIYDKIEQGNIVSSEYSKYCVSPDNSDDKFLYIKTDSVSLGYDKVKLYFVSGYDFSDIYAALLRISVPRSDGSLLDLCNFIYTKGTVYKYVTYMTKPIIFGNFIYDKYIEISIPSIKNFFTAQAGDTYLGKIFLDSDDSERYAEPNLKLVFSYIEDSDVTIKDSVVYENNIAIESYSNTNCFFSKTNSIKGTVPLQSLTSDNLGVYIAENPDYPYLEFYGTWKGEQLTSKLINTFNTTVKLYDRSYVRKESTYEISKDYQVGDNLKQWVAVHEISTELLDLDLNIVKSDMYSMTQTFTNDETETTKFYYRPVYFDDANFSFKDLVMHIKYTMRLINIEDGVQFLKQGTLSITDLNKFQIKLNKIAVNTNPYKVFNKIVENKQELTGKAQTLNIKSKYVKVFYNSSQILLDENGVVYNNGTYQLVLSRAPKNYKFVFKQKDFNDNIKYFDLTDSYYKLYVKESNGNEIIIEPTYSNNMNLALGELEFNFNNNIINKLRAVSSEDRYISIVSYNSDGSISTMYDMRYTI